MFNQENIADLEMDCHFERREKSGNRGNKQLQKRSIKIMTFYIYVRLRFLVSFTLFIPQKKLIDCRLSFQTEGLILMIECHKS